MDSLLTSRSFTECGMTEIASRVYELQTAKASKRQTRAQRHESKALLQSRKEGMRVAAHGVSTSSILARFIKRPRIPTAMKTTAKDAKNAKRQCPISTRENGAAESSHLRKSQKPKQPDP
ncbi:hypothetical protein FF011L_36620 [Roseimaritima multifibrata]|uniref:Uncharacterized protein n=1 Tax=Roseimaritima multifibrata TaxID=1930274 RepID=A0A517MJ59_9BACT|nr:hypothetical protein FF011L_36620 [Roseimaritima multifibrata]